MGNCLSSDKGSSDPGNPSSSNKQQNENSATQGAGRSSNNALNSYSLSNSRNDNSHSSSDGSAASPLSGAPNGSRADRDESSTTNGTKVTKSTNDISTNGSSNNINNSRNGSVSNTAQDSKGRQEVKILLLGSGESGKSTILKQMKILHQNGYSQEDLLMYKTTVYKNLLDCAKAIVAALEQFDLSVVDEDTSESNEQKQIPSHDTESDETALVNGNGSMDEKSSKLNQVATPGSSDKITHEELELIKTSIISPDPDTVFDPQLAKIISKIWAHPNVKKIFNERRAQFYIMDSAPYFFNNVERIGDYDYTPNVADILRARIKTTGIYDTKFEMGKLNIHMFDVGGQRSERRKWINCFDNVTLIIFCVALSEYDQVLLEESSQNRMAESLVLFDSIINSRWFARTSVVLFLNKIDVFTEKLPYSPLENYFPDYTGGNDIKNAAKYILWRFNNLNRNQVTIYPHLTQATDTSNIKLVFAAIKETILQNSLRDSGIL